MIASMDDSDFDSDTDDGMPAEDASSLDGEQELAPISPDLQSATELQNGCAVGHRVNATRSVLALAMDEECVFAGLQGGDIVVSPHVLTLALCYRNFLLTSMMNPGLVS